MVKGAIKVADCGPLTCPDPRGRTIKAAGHTASAAAGQASRWLIERVGAFRREMEEMEKKRSEGGTKDRNGRMDVQ